VSEMNTIGVLTSGGDCPGMNAAIRAVVQRAILNGVQVKGIMRGYAGLMENEIIDMSLQSVSDIAREGGTILYTARCPEFVQPEVLEKGVRILKSNGIDGLVVIGGDGSFKGAADLAKYGVKVVCIPATIDLDIGCTDYTIGFDTAVNTAVTAIDSIKDTSMSHERCSIIEVMGRNAGYIALWCEIANGADGILIPEKDAFDEQELIENIMENRRKGKTHHIIINAEGVGESIRLAKRIEAATGIETRATILGHIQRGGTPSAKDRVYGAVMGACAADLLSNGKSQRVIVYKDGRMQDLDIWEALEMKKTIDEYQLLTSRLV